MKIYLLSYELRDSDKDYTSLYEHLEKSGDNRIHVLKDSWWIASENAIDIDAFCNELRALMSENDVFFMQEILDAKINGWLAGSSWNWYKEQKRK